MRGDYKSHLSRELRTRRKSPTESMIMFITSIQTICHDLDQNMSTEQIIDYCLDGLEPDIACQIQCFNPTSIKELIKCAKSVELAMDKYKTLGSGSTGAGPSTGQRGGFSGHNRKINSVVNEPENDEFFDSNNKTVNALYRGGGHSHQNRGRGQSSWPNRGNRNAHKFNNYRSNTESSQQSSGNFNANRQRYDGRPNFVNSAQQGRDKRNDQCNNCGKFGHYSRECRSPPRSSQPFRPNRFQNNFVSDQAQVRPNAEPSNAFANLNINSIKNSQEMRNIIVIEVQISNKPFYAIVDSGAESTLMTRKVAESLNLRLVPYSGKRLTTASNQSMPTIGSTNIEMAIKAVNLYKQLVEIIVVEDLPSDILLGLDSISKFNINIEGSTKTAFIEKNPIETSGKLISNQYLSSIPGEIHSFAC